jgi:hypothetical protein
VEEIFPAVKRPDREFNHSRPSNSEVKNEWSHNFTPLCLHGLGRDNFTLRSFNDIVTGQDGVVIKIQNCIMEGRDSNTSWNTYSSDSGVPICSSVLLETFSEYSRKSSFRIPSNYNEVEFELTYFENTVK